MTRKRDQIARKVAEMYQVSVRYVRMVRNGDRKNDAIFATIMDLKEGETALLEQAKKHIPQDYRHETPPLCTLFCYEKQAKQP